jgi:aminopeptidase N
MNPYLDEALASYSELIYFEHYYPETLDWWWELRVTPYITDTVVDSSVYDFTTVRPYINAVYLRGASMLHDIRQRVGDDLFFAWLKDYTTQNRGRIVLPIDFWGSLSETEYLLIADIRAQYLAQAEILPTATSNVLSQDSASE